jgi:DNA polymerase III epsilon subunit-like protein
MEITIYDTETTGLLLPDNAPVEKQPKIIEFYAVKLNENFEIIDEVNHLIHPSELISDEITRITGIKNRDLDGKPTFQEVAADIHGIIEGTDLLVAHNLSFDLGMVTNECKRWAIEPPTPKRTLCTVEATMGIKGFRLSLPRLHYILFQKEFKAHRAKADVFALVRCFHELTERGVIDLDLYKD